MTAKRSGPASDRDTEQEQDYRSAMRDAIGTHWAAVWKALPAVRAGNDPEAVHKVRVASRRLRAAMDVAVDCFPPKWYRPLHKTAKRITRALGDVRDRDVMLAALARERESASGAERQAIDHLIAGLTRDRKRARRAMVAFLAKLDDKGVRKETKRRFPRAKGSRAVVGHAPGSRPRSADQRGQPGDSAPHDEGPVAGRGSPLPPLDPEASLATNARRVLAVRADALFGYGPVIPDAAASEALHDARIAAKRLRYTLELFRSVFGEEGERAIGRLRELQEELGELHDHDVRIALMMKELADLDGAGKARATELRSGFEALLRRERDARATRHAAVVEGWRRLERDDLQARLMVLSADAG
jgi:CHAD domain-containing protein